MSKSGLVSIIIPVFNCEKYLERCLNSLVTQSYGNFEAIVINDGSTDNSGNIIREYADKYNNFLIISQPNSGVSAARNIGVKKASGEYLLFVDGDDYLSEEYLRILVEAAVRETSDLVICGCTIVDQDGRIIKELIPGAYKKEEQEEWAYRLSSVCSHLYRRRLWIDSGIKFAEGVRGEDVPIDIYFNYTCSNIVMLQESGYFYVQHKDSAMGSARGLQNFQLPLDALQDTLDKLCNMKAGNSHEFLEYGVLKALAMFHFDLGRGASWHVIRELCQQTEKIVLQYFPNFKKNEKLRWNSHIDMPFRVKGATWLLTKLLQLHLLTPFMWVYCKVT